MSPDLGKSNILQIPSKVKICMQAKFSIYMYNVWITSVLSMSIYTILPSVSYIALCNTAITIANIDKIKCQYWWL